MSARLYQVLSFWGKGGEGGGRGRLWENEGDNTIMICMYEGVIFCVRQTAECRHLLCILPPQSSFFQTNSTRMQNVCTGAVVFFSVLFAVLADPQPPIWQPTWSQSFLEVLFLFLFLPSDSNQLWRRQQRSSRNLIPPGYSIMIAPSMPLAQNEPMATAIAIVEG